MEKKEIKINLDAPVAFNPVGDIRITSTNELAKLINDVMSQAFKDYYGCSLTVQLQPEIGRYIIVPKIFFHVLKQEEYNDTDLFGFIPLASQPANDIVGRVQRLSQITTTAGVKVSMTDEAKSILEDFIIAPSFKSAKFDWNTAYSSAATESETLITVFKLDIIKFIKKIFGEKDANGSPLYYQVNPLYVIGGNQQYKSSDNWALNILRLNHANEVEAAELLGFGLPYQVGPNIVTAKTTK